MFLSTKINLFFIISIFLTFENSVFSVDYDLEKYPELVKFAERYSCSPDIEQQARQEKEKGYICKKFFIKTETGFHDNKAALHRVINAMRLRNFMKAHELDCLGVAKKCLCRDNDREIISSNYDINACDDVHPYNNPKQKITSKEVQQLAVLTEKTGFFDWSRDLRSIHSSNSNVRMNTNGTLIFIDTEDRSFGVRTKEHSKVDHLQQLQFFLKKSGNTVEVDAMNWLENRISLLKNSPEGQELPVPLWKNSQYDDPGINFEAVKKEYRAYRKAEILRWSDEI